MDRGTLRKYLAYLKQNVRLACRLTGIEDYRWEAPYVFGYGDQAESERLKKTRPSYTDTFELLGSEEEVEADHGIIVNVKCVSDRRKFALPLADLKVTDKQSQNYQLFDAFAVWFVNWR